MAESEREPLLRRRSETSVQNAIEENANYTFTNKISKAALVWTLIGLWSAVLLGALDGTIVATLISPIGSYFRQSHKASYLGTSYLLSVCCFTPLYGRLSDILGRKGAMLLALILFTGGTLLCGLASSMDGLIIARAIAGMGGGGIRTVASITVTDLIPLKQRGLFQGMSNVLFGLGAGAGGPLGGLINDTIGWRWAFLFQVPLLVISMAIVAFKMNNIELPSEIQNQSTYEKLRRIDLLGSLTLVCTVGCFLLGVSVKTTEDVPWSSPLIWGLLLGAGISLVLFIAVEARWSVSPVMPIRLLTQRTPMAVVLGSFLLSITYYSMLYNVPLYFSAVRLMTASQAGSRLIPNAVALSTGSILAGWIMHRTGKLYYLTLASAFLTVVSSALVASWNKNTSAFELWFDVAPNGFGDSSLLTTLLIALVASVPREDMAVATGSEISSLHGMHASVHDGVLGVTLSGTIVQGVLLRRLRERITGPGSQEIIQHIRRNVNSIARLELPLKQAAIESYADALRTVFICQVGIAVCTVLVCLPVEENPLPDSHEGMDEQDRRRREGQTITNRASI